jgi:hypothetical protein
MVHQMRLRTRLKSEGILANLAVLLHAMTAITLKRIAPEEYNITQVDVERQISLSRNLVLLNAFNELNVENLQALIMITFDRIGSGNVSGAWSLVGSLTRTVDYLQLTVEPTSDKSRALLEPLECLESPKDFVEAEERRRIFWNVFLLDRFCSVACGWNTGLTSDNVSRQLPCNGGVWARNEHATAPFFGLWDKQAAKMGNPITFLPVHRASQSDQGQMHNVSPGGPPETDMRANLGAVAYRIEATESLSQISSFFLQQRVDFYNKEEVTNWLTRFKELDLRLVHWKLFLPRRWKDSNISEDEAQVRMDPNLTLAHVTHNASMILLHQHIAYPVATLRQMVNLPSTCSAETCQRAAVETASIAKKYLKYTKDIMVPSEFAFCTYLAARALLVHCRYFDVEPAPEIFELIQCLDEMSSRWHGKEHVTSSSSGSAPSASDLAGRYATHLRQLQTESMASADFVTDILFRPGASLFMPEGSKHVSSPFAEHSPSQKLRSGILQSSARTAIVASPDRKGQSVLQRHPSSSNAGGQNAQMRAFFAGDMLSMPPGGAYSKNDLQTTRASTLPSTQDVNVSLVSPQSGTFEPNMQYHDPMQTGLIDMSDSILGQHFANLDRVITFDGADFALDSAIGFEYVS